MIIQAHVWREGDEVAIDENGITKRGLVVDIRTVSFVVEFYDVLDDGGRRRAFFKDDREVRLISQAVEMDKREGQMEKAAATLSGSRLCKHCGEAVVVPPGFKALDVMRDHFFRCPKKPPYGSIKRRRQLHRPSGNPPADDSQIAGQDDQARKEVDGLEIRLRALGIGIRALGEIVEEFQKRGVTIEISLRGGGGK